LERVSLGKAPIDHDRDKERIVIADAVAEYLQESPTLDKAKTTIVAYTNTLEGFIQSCTKIYADEIDRKGVIDYIGWMRKNLPKRKHGEQNRTIRDRLTYLGTFLGQKCGIHVKKAKGADATAPGLLFVNDVPKYTKRTPDKYSVKTINALLAVADKREQLLIEFFLYTGVRVEEAAHIEWSDFDEHDRAKIRVQPKPQYGWKVKDHEVRDIDLLPSKFVGKMIKYRDSIRNVIGYFRQASANQISI
jgi:integrase